MKIFEDNSRSIGNTPLVKLNHVIGTKKATVLAKIEGRNPAYSVKCRIGAGIIEDAEKRGLLGPGKEIIEATSGNTGIGLAYAAAARGIRLTIVMPDTMSVERRKVLKMFKAELILTPGAEGMVGAIRKAEKMIEAEPDRFFVADQFRNPANPATHERTTGPEIWFDTDGKVDVVVAGVGTGGTLTGISRFIKNKQGKSILSVAVEPKESPVLTQHLAKKPLKPGPHLIQGIGAGFIPETLDISLVDRVVTVEGPKAISMARRLAGEEGILCGISSGAAVLAAAKIAQEDEFEGKTIVVILPDTGERYLSTALFEGME